MATFGYPITIGSNYTFCELFEERKIASRHTNNSGNFTVRSMRAFCSLLVGDLGRLAIYDTSGNLLGETETFDGTSSLTWQEADLITPVAVTDATDYYLAIHSNDLCWVRYNGSLDTWENDDTFAGGISDPFGSDAGGTDVRNAIIADSSALPSVVIVNELTLASSVESSSVVDTARVIPVNELTLAGSAEATILFAEFFVSAAELTLAGTAVAFGVVPGGISVTMNTVTLASSVPNSTPGLSVVAATLTLAGSAETVILSIGPVTILAAELTMTSSTETGAGLSLPFVNADYVSPAELVILRDDEHSMEIYGSALVPADIWSARINNASIGRGDTAIVFDDGSGSDFTLVEGYQEVWVGTSAGDSDVGRLRVRGISSGDAGVTGTLTAAPHPWIIGDDHYLTFKLDYPIRQAFPLILGDGTFLKDRIIAYGDENKNTAPVGIAGPHRSAFIGTTDVDFDVDASRSYATAEGATITSYGLSILPATGSSVVFSSSNGTGTVTFTTTGQRWAKFTVTDSNGTSQVTYRCFFVHSTDPTDADYPLFKFHNFRMSGSWTRGGWQSFFTATGDASLSDVPDETLMVVWADEEYQGVQQTITLLPDAATTLLAGYLIRSNANSDLETGLQRVDFEIHTIQEMMRRYNFSVSLEAVEGTPNEWYKFKDWLTVGRAIHHLWLHHSSVMHVTDVLGLLNNTIRRAYSEFEEGDLYSMADGFAKDRGIRAHVVCDKAGRVHVTHDLQLLTDSERASLPKAFDITMDDRRGNLRLDAQSINRAAFVKTSGFSWDGSFRTDESGNRVPDAVPLCASAPGIIPDDEGQNVINFDRQTFRDQTHCDEIAGRVFAKQNNEYPNVPVVFHGNYVGVLDVAYEIWYMMSVQSVDTARGVVWTDQKLACRTVAVQYDGDKGAMLVQANMEAEQSAVIGVAGYCLDSFPEAGGEPPLVPDADGLPDALMTGGSIHFKSAAGKAWALRSTDSVRDLAQDPFWPAKQASVASNDAIVFSCGLGFIKRSTDAFQTSPTDVTPATNPPNDAGDAPAPTVAQVEFIRVEGNTFFQDEFVAVGRWQNATSDWRSWIASTRDNGTTWEWMSIGDFESPASSTDITGYAFTDLDTASTAQPIRGVKMNSVRYFAHTDGIKGHILSRSGNTFTLEASATATGNAVRVENKVFRLSDSEAWAVGSNTDVPPGSENVNVVAQEWSMTDTTVSHVATYVSPEVPVVTEASKVLTPLRYTSLTDGRLVYLYRHSFAGDILIGMLTFDTVTNTWSDVDILFQQIGGGSWSPIDIIGLDDRHVMMFANRTSAISGVEVWIRDMNTGIDGLATLVSADHTVVFQSDSRTTKLSDNRVAVATIRNNGATNLLEPHIVQWDGLTTAAPMVGPTADLMGLGDDSEDDVNLVSDGIDHILAVRDYNGSFNGQRAVSWQVQGLTAYRNNNLNFVNQTEVDAGYFRPMEALFHDTGNFWVNLSRRNFITPGYPRIQRLEVEDPGPLTFTGGFRALGASVGKGLGSNVWVTAHDETNLELALFEYLLPVPTWLRRVPIGDASIAEVDAETYIARPYAGPGDDGWVVIYGRMNDPDGLGNPQHIIETFDFANSFSSLEASWGTDLAGAVIVEADTLISAIRNRPTSAKLYRGLVPPLLLMSTLDFAQNVAPRGMEVDIFSGAVYACSDTGTGIMVLKSLAPYLAWENLTYDHGTAAGINTIILL